TEDRSKSRYGYLFFVLGGLVSWTSTNSTRVMTSSTEAECHGLSHTSRENIWIREFLQELKLFSKLSPTVVFQDNKSAISLSSGGPSHKRSKHFGIDFDSFWERVELRVLQLFYRETDDLPAVMFTKTVRPEKFVFYRDFLMGRNRNTSSSQQKKKKNCAILFLLEAKIFLLSFSALLSCFLFLLFFFLLCFPCL